MTTNGSANQPSSSEQQPSTADRPLSQGSTWRRWDPHVHMPGTLLNDQFSGLSVDQALEALSNAAPRIEAIGVTDYFTTASFRRVADALARGVAPTIRFAFPNVELRLDNATSSNHGVNIHLLAPPEEVDGLDQFLGGLEFSWSDRQYRADYDGLVRLGRDYQGAAALSETDALRVGANQFKVNFEALRTRLRNDKWAKETLLVAVSGGQGDGTSGLRDPAGAFAARRQSIEALADIIFSGNPRQAEFWSGQGAMPEAELRKVYGGLKLCLHGSDAHSEDRLGQPDQDRHCWLNGAPAFDTLRLACLSPTTRGSVGADPPGTGTTHGRIVNVHVPNLEWFVNGAVPLNPGLVAIIGARGSGKTALADVIAAAAGSPEPFDNDASFVRRAGRLLHGTSATVDWSHGESTACSFDAVQAVEPFVRPVRYLSQQFVERLCAADGVSDELLAEIERVIFEAWPVDERQGASTFRQLLDIRLVGAKGRQETQLDAILDLSDRITEIRLRRRALGDKRTELTQRKKRLSDLRDEIKNITGHADKTSAERHALVASVLRDRQEQAQKLDRRRSALQGLQSAVRSARTTSFPGHLERLQHAHGEASLDESEWLAFSIDFVGDVDNTLKANLEANRLAIEAIAGEPVEPSNASTLDALDEGGLRARTIAELRIEEARLQKLVGLDAARQKKLGDLTKAAGDETSRCAGLEQEIERAESETTEQLVERRLHHYALYFEALLEEEQELRELYAPLDVILQRFGSSVAKLRFAVKRDVDVSQWAAEGESLLDLRKDGRFRGEGELARIATAELLDAWQEGNSAAAASAIGGFATEYSDDLRKQMRLRSNVSQDVGEWERSVSRWLYRTDHITLRYSLEYDGLSIERLSPGSRGIVLLLLYLAVDQEEADPLIIDQPEENLDPESVYSELVRLFRSASQRRQIIMVTHNANLVVNTDVDQVIVASCGSLAEGRLPELSYISGGLEDPVIRRAVCEVLEGGAEAFRERARRLGLDLGDGDRGSSE